MHPRRLVFLYLHLLNLLGLKRKVKDSALLVDRCEVDYPIEVVDNHSADHETEADAICVYLLFLVFVGSEQFEQLLVVGLLDAEAVVLDGYQDEIVILLSYIWHDGARILPVLRYLNLLNKHLYLLVFLGKLQRVCQNVKNDLLDSFLVSLC